MLFTTPSVICELVCVYFVLERMLLYNSGFNRLDNEIFVNKNHGVPSVIQFHPYESELAVADKDGVA